jgi:alpha-ketoglutarate-dependent 2,4-dichlorophenoxyacetate dioxygenase
MERLMTICIKNLERMGVEVSGIELGGPLSAADGDALKNVLVEHALVVIHDQPVDDDQQMAITGLFGPAQITYSAINGRFKRRISRPDFSDIANLDENGQLLKEDDERRIFSLSNQIWHCDTTFKRIPTAFAFLSAREIPPEGGNTEWVDLRAAYEDLPNDLKSKIEGLIVEHSQYYSRGKMGFTNFTDEERAKFPPVPHPLVRMHASGRKTLYLSSHASHILGWPEAEGRQLIADLTAHATQEAYRYTHVWRVGDFVAWDNRCTMHRVRPFDEFKYRRVLARTGVDEPAAPVELGSVRYG